MIEKKILICGVIKNIEKTKFLKNIILCHKTGKNFNDYRIIIYENNSTDNTKKILEEIKDEKVIIKSEDLILNNETCDIWSYKEVTGSDHSCRIENISNARNKVIDIINKNEYDDFDYVMWIDLDGGGFRFINYDFFKEDWDVIYGVSNPYYDYYALRLENDLDPCFLGEEWWKNYKNLKVKRNKKKVLSAFNGIGIFKKNIFKEFKYDYKVNEDIKKVYRKTINTEEYNEFKYLIEKDCEKFPGGLKDTESNIVWKNNSGYKGLVVCEHVCLNFALVNKGYNILIHPNIIYRR